MIRKEVAHKDVYGAFKPYPRFYGFAWSDMLRRCDICYPIPLNLVVRWVRAAHFWTTYNFRPSWFDRELQKAVEAGIVLGLQASEVEAMKIELAIVTNTGHKLQAACISLRSEADGWKLMYEKAAEELQAMTGDALEKLSIRHAERMTEIYSELQGQRDARQGHVSSDSGQDAPPVVGNPGSAHLPGLPSAP